MNRDQVGHPFRHLSNARGSVDLRFRCDRSFDSQILRHVRVREKMRFQVASLVEASRANWTFVWRFLHVQNLVNSQSPTLTKSFSAFAALEGFLLAMDISEKENNSFFLLSRRFLPFSFSPTEKRRGYRQGRVLVKYRCDQILITIVIEIRRSITIEFV